MCVTRPTQAARFFRRALLPAGCCVWMLLAGAADTPAGAAPQIPELTNVAAFDLDTRHNIVFDAAIGGRGGFRFLLDTGSSRTVIATPIAERLGLTAVASAEIVTPAGSAVLSVVWLPRLLAAGIEKADLPAVVLDRRQLPSAAGDVDGILGMDFLAGQRYTVDYRRRLLRWGDAAPEGPREGIRLPARWSEGRCLVAVPIKSGQPPLWLVADSGAHALVLFSTAATDRLHLDPGARPVVVDTLAGRRFADHVLIPQLVFGERRLRNVRAVRINRQRDGAAEGDGLLPLKLFAEVSFDPGADAITVLFR